MGRRRQVVLLEPERAPGFVSGGYRYQDLIGRWLLEHGEGHQRAIASHSLAATIAELQRAPNPPTVVVDGLFHAITDQPLPEQTIALLHMAPRRENWAAAPLHVITTSAVTAAAVRTTARSVDIVRPGLDACFVPAPTVRRGPRLRVVCVGTISPAKGQRLLARSLAAMAGSARPDELALLGDDRQDPAYTAAVRAAAGDLPVRFAGCVPTDRVARELQESDLFVSASREESFGMAVAEAAACAVPVFAFETGEIRSFVEHGTNGWLVPATASETEFAERLANVLASPSRLLQARAAARRPPLLGWDAVGAAFHSRCRSTAER